jgi:hypothetical protein
MGDFPNTADLQRVAYDEMLTRSALLTREVVERAGSDANALASAPVAVGDVVVGLAIRVQAALYSDTAKGKDLDRLLFDRYQLLRKPAGPGIGEVTWALIVNNVPVVSGSNFLIPEKTQVKTQDGRVYETTEARLFPSGSSSLSGVPIQSVLAGLSQQARQNTITSIASTVSGAPAGLTVNNPLATAGATDEETDEAFRIRGKLFYTTSARGTLSAIVLGALSVIGINAAQAFEFVESDGTPARVVEVVVTDAFTEQLVDTTVAGPVYQAQSQQIALVVQSALNDVRAAGIQVVVTVGSVILLGIMLTLRFRAGADPVAAAAAARGAVLAYTNGLRQGQTWVLADALTQLSTVPGLTVTGGEILEPLGDVVPTAVQVLRTTNALVTVGLAEQES